jgi:hypothetical protein
LNSVRDLDVYNLSFDTAMPKKWASDRPSPELASGRSPLLYTPFSKRQDAK